MPNPALLGTSTPVAADEPVYLVQDTFTDSDGVLLVNHTPDIDTVGGGWFGATQVVINSNKAKCNINNDLYFVFIDPNISDLVVKANINQRIGIVARASGDANLWLLGANGATLQRLLERTSNSWYVRSTTSYADVVDAPVVFTLNGTSITSTYNGQAGPSYTSSQHQSNRDTGIRYILTTNSADNFTIEAAS